MKLSDLGEFGLIEQIRKSAGRPPSPVTIGIGDDAAVLKVPAASMLASTDMLIERVHFDLSYTDFFSLGWKSAAVNLSDIAAMGGLPRFCLTSLGIPASISAEQIAEFYRGCNTLLRSSGAVLVGGDTCFSRKDLVVSVTVLGEAVKAGIISRGGAKPGDRIFVTGTLGDSAAGLEILKRRGKGPGSRVQGGKSAIRNPKSGMKVLIMRHLRPEPRVEWGKKIAFSQCAHAMIDISDGLSSDLSHICEQSRVGALIAAEKIPLSPWLLKAAGRLGKPPIHYALSGGEDYELLFTVPPDRIGKLQKLGLPITEIGEITGARNMMIADGGGNKRLLRPTGYNHFARSRK